VALYTCKVKLPDAPNGTSFPLPCPAAASSAGDGTPITTTCNPGSVSVSDLASLCPGDCNADGRVRANESLIILNIAAKKLENTPENCKKPDANGDGTVRANDSLVALNIAAGKLGCDLQPK